MIGGVQPQAVAHRPVGDPRGHLGPGVGRAHREPGYTPALAAHVGACYSFGMAEIVTIGAYGWTQERFFDALTGARVRTFCDVRRRRGVRGHEYAFANSARLQSRLAELGIGYVHRLDLAPSEEVRRMQELDDRRLGVARRRRTRIDEAFARAYEAECLTGFDPAGFLAEVVGAGTACLFCVEGEPAACHRSLIAGRLEAAGATCTHLLPEPAG